VGVCVGVTDGVGVCDALTGTTSTCMKPEPEAAVASSVYPEPAVVLASCVVSYRYSAFAVAADVDRYSAKPLSSLRPTRPCTPTAPTGFLMSPTQNDAAVHEPLTKPLVDVNLYRPPDVVESAPMYMMYGVLNAC